MLAINKKQKSIFGKSITTLFFILNVLVVMLLLSSLLTIHISPDRFLFFAYLGLCFAFIYFAILLFIFIWAIKKKWKFVLFNLFFVAICYVPIKSYSPLNFFSSKAPENSVRLMTYNVRGFAWNVNRGWDDQHPMIQYIKSVNPDVICMQEYLNVTWGAKTNTTQLLRALKDYPYYVMTPLRPTTRFEYGILCLSKYPIKKSSVIPIVTSDNGAVLYELDINGKTVSLINVHLESNRLTSNDRQLYKKFIKQRDSQLFEELAGSIEKKLGGAYKARALQADLISHVVNEQNTDATILCGDFNDTPVSYVYNTLTKDLKDSYVDTGFGPAITYHENYFWFRIDFILHSKNIKAYNTTIDKVKYSDHYPVWANLKID